MLAEDCNRVSHLFNARRRCFLRPGNTSCHEKLNSTHAGEKYSLPSERFECQDRQLGQAVMANQWQPRGTSADITGL